MVRTFVALLIPKEWIDYLAGIQRDLSAATSGLSWTKPENLHLTLRFLGDLGDSGVKRAGLAVARGAEESPAVAARLGGLGTFPRNSRPRVLWAGLAEGAEEASALAAAVNRALMRDGFGAPDKPFQAHMTLARVREGARGLDALAGYAMPPPPGGALLDQVTLMKSELHPAGARYTPLVEVRLRQPGP
jgi:2'-5' RNA ligase